MFYTLQEKGVIEILMNCLYPVRYLTKNRNIIILWWIYIFDKNNKNIVVCMVKFWLINKMRKENYRRIKEYKFLFSKFKKDILIILYKFSSSHICTALCYPWR